MGTGASFANAVVFNQSNQSGNGILVGSANAGRYAQYTGLQAYADDLWNMRSATITDPLDKGASSLIIFESSIFGVSPAPQTFQGDFVQYTNFDAQDQWKVNFKQLDSQRARSAMVIHVATGASELRLFASDLVKPQLETAAAMFAENEDVEISFVGAPIIGWWPFDANTQYLNSNHIYLSVYQKLEVDVSLNAYDVVIRFWIRLFRTSGGQIRGWVQRWSAWIEGGLFTSFIAAVLDPTLKLVAIDMNEAMENLGEAQDIYLLPDRQLNPSLGHSVLTGNTSDDVTIVLVLK